MEYDNRGKVSLWKSDKGGCFTTIEREIMKSADFRKLYVNEGETA